MLPPAFIPPEMRQISWLAGRRFEFKSVCPRTLPVSRAPKLPARWKSFPSLLRDVSPDSDFRSLDLSEAFRSGAIFARLSRRSKLRARSRECRELFSFLFSRRLKISVQFGTLVGKVNDPIKSRCYQGHPLCFFRVYFSVVIITRSLRLL